MTSTFFVAGVPQPKGSARAFVNKYTGRANVIQDNSEKQAPWASAITATAQQRGIKPTRGLSVALAVTFYMPRPKGHYGTGRNLTKLKASAPAHHIVKPDSDKLLRLVMDALTGVAYVDDAQVNAVVARKVYVLHGEYVGAEITVVQH